MQPRLRWIRVIRSAGVLALLSLAAVTTAGAQDRWSWPEKPKNLKELPKDMTGEKLRPVMMGFTRSLGVRCSYCHVGEEGKPLSTYDFASDANPNKDRARAMLRMLGSVNDHLGRIEPSGEKRVNMWCHTCHRGAPRPMTLQEDLGEVYRKSGIDAAIARYHKLREQYDDRGTYDFREGSLNAFGHELLGLGDSKGAITVFRLNTTQYAQAGNTWDSLAEAYQKDGNEELAKIYYRKSLELDPENTHALEMLRGMEKKTDPK